MLGLGGREAGTVTLAHHRVFILPTAGGLAFGACLLLMLVTSVNYGLSLGFGLTFLLASLGFVTILHAFRNLVGIEIQTGRCEQVFAGEPLQFPLTLVNRREHARPGIVVRWDQRNSIQVQLPPGSEQRIALAIPTRHRGYLWPGRMTLETRFPLGLIRAWSHVEPDVRCLVYPAPERSPPPLPASRQGNDAAARDGAGHEDFVALRPYQPADSPRHVAWKAVARGAPLVTKHFAGGGSRVLLLDWNVLPAQLGTEARLSRLTQWVIDAERQGLTYELRIPGAHFSPGCGTDHLRACLQALALHDEHKT